MDLNTNSISCHECKSKENSMFFNCPDPGLDMLTYAKNTQEYEEGELIVRQGAFPSGVYCVSEGVVKVVHHKIDQKEDFILWFAKKGEVIGLYPLLNQRKFPYSIVASTPARVCFIPGNEFSELLLSESDVKTQVMKVLCQRINFMEERLTSISQRKTRERLAELLLWIATDGKGIKASDPEKLKNSRRIQYSMADIASIIGTTRNYLYKLLNKFAQKKLVSLHKRELQIIDHENLILVANGEISI